MNTRKKTFVAPSVTVEASLEDVTLISGGGGRKNHGSRRHGRRHNRRHNYRRHRHNHGNRGS